VLEFAAMKSQVTLTLVALLPACTLFVGSVVLFSTEKTLPSLLQVLGAGCLVIVVLAHICEALRLIPSLEWGRERSVGHYLDLGSAVICLTSFPLGYLLQMLKPRL